MFDPAVVDPVIDLLVELDGSGRARELGIGTGWIALPLAQRGVPVHEIELSKAMVARLRAKPGGEDIGVTIGDFATTTVDGTFSVAYLGFNTILNLTTQAARVACFCNVAAHVEAGGFFLIEVGVPGLQRLPPGETIRALHVSETRWGFDEYDVPIQDLTSHHFEIVDVRPKGPQVPSPHEAPPHLPRTLARWAPTADRPFDYFGGDRCRRVAGGDPGEERRADRARAGRSWPGVKLELLVASV
jgi:methyltransferase family protein